MRKALQASIAALTLLVYLSHVSSAKKVVQKVEQSKETITIKNKLATAETRVGDLISRLDSVSDDASRAKGEIHSTLMEVWRVVDLLGKDQCGEVVDKVRVAQKKAENRVNELEEEIRVHLRDIEKLRVDITKSDNAVDALQTEIRAERSRRETLEAETRELQDKLHWASAISNETEKYELVAERLQNLLVIVTERTALLKRVLTMVDDAHSGFTDWQKEIESLGSVVRQTERDFSSGYKGAAVDGLRRQIIDLESKLRDSASNRETLLRERNSLRKSVNDLHRTSSARTTTATSSTSGDTNTRERIIVRTESSDSWSGWTALALISFCSGGLLAMVLGYWQEGRGQPMANANGRDSDKFGFTPGSGSRGSRHSPGVPVGTSPLTYVQDGSGPRTPGSRGSTPRRY